MTSTDKGGNVYFKVITEAMLAAESIQKSRVWFGDDADVLAEIDSFRKSGLKILGYINTHADHIKDLEDVEIEFAETGHGR